MIENHKNPLECDLGNMENHEQKVIMIKTTFH